MQPELEVDERLLSSIAANVDDVAATLQAGVKAAGSGLAPPAQPGAAAAAARTAEQLWLADLGRLHADIDAFATDLVTSAKEFLATDQASADGLRGAGR